MADFGNFGLDSAADLGVGSCDRTASRIVDAPFTAVNPGPGSCVFLQPIGRSVYNALDVKLVDNVKAPFRGVKYLNFQFAYLLSRFTNCGGRSFHIRGYFAGSRRSGFRQSYHRQQQSLRI